MRSLRLLLERRFGALFAVQFLGAFNDNVFKQALIVFFALRFQDQEGQVSFLSNVATGLLILPFFLFSATAGQVADKVEKSRLIRIIKAMEVLIMVGAALVFPTMSVVALLALLFLMGLQSAVFGPVKYSILPQVLSEEELVAGNGLIEMGTYLAILAGTILGGVLAALGGAAATTAVGGTVVGLAALGLVAAFAMPTVPSPAPDLRVRWNVLGATVRTIRFATEQRAVWLSILGNSWFWFFGTLFLAQMPGFATEVVGGDAAVLTTLLIAFSVGIGLGSLLCDRLSSGHIELGLVPFGALGMTIFAVDLFFATEWRALPPAPQGPLELVLGATPGQPASWPFHNWRWLLDLVLLGVFGGFYSVPLNAIIQHRSDPDRRSRIIAGNNIINALFMVAAPVLALGLLGAGLSIPEVFLVAGIANALVAVYIFTLLPEFLLRFLVWMLMHTMYRLRAEGTEHFPKEGPAVLICNHITYVDALVLSAACHRPIRFIMWYKIYRIPALNPILRLARAIPIASKKEVPGMAERALDEAAAALAAGELLCIFPEGGLTRTGDLEPFRPGVERIVGRTPVPVIPMALRGMWGSWFSRRGGAAMRKRPRRFRSRIELVVGPPLPPEEATVERLEPLVRAMRGEMR